MTPPPDAPLPDRGAAPTLSVTPIGCFHCPEQYPYDAARQGSLGTAEGTVELFPGHDYATALRDLDGFSHLWLLYWFHHNRHWRPLIQPPRGERKVGVFACRAPYRPNPIGLSCVELLGIRGRAVRVRGHDLLDGTPILDLKPYLPYADSHPAARTGWLEQAAQADPPWEIEFTPWAATQLAWLAARRVACLEPFLRQQLAHAPLDSRRKRVRELPDGTAEIAYRTWRARFTADAARRAVRVQHLASGYTAAELADAADRHGDKPVHRLFQARWGTADAGIPLP